MVKLPFPFVLLLLPACVFDPSGLAADDAGADIHDAWTAEDTDVTAPDATAPDALPPIPDAGPCPGYTAVGNGWYRVEPVEAGFATAEATCEATGGHLVVIESAVENATVRGLTSLPVLLVGLLDVDGDLVFAWVDGSPLSYTNWAAGQPDGQACVEMASDGLWWDLDWGASLPYVCECGD